MEKQVDKSCPYCLSADIKIHRIYTTVNNGNRTLYECNNCSNLFSETSGTPMEGIKSPISKVASALKIRSEGMGLRATGRILGSTKGTISKWEKLFADQKDTLMLYVFCHEFISLTFEGDELYTIVGKRTDPSDSKAWTAVIMERGSRFVLEQKCGKKDEKLFETVMKKVCAIIENTGDVTFLSDGERRYGNILFALCAEILQTGKPGRSAKKLSKGVKVRVKIKVAKVTNVALNVQNIRLHNQSILTQFKILKTRIFMPIISKARMRLLGEEIAHSEDAPTHMQKQKTDFKEL